MPEPIEPGRVLGGRYRLQHEIARGGMGSVWKAEDPLLSRIVAVKILDPALAADEKLRARFRREAVSAAAVSHPNIVATYDTGDDDGCAYIVMELVEGRTLRRVIDEMGPLPVPLAADIAYQVADALSMAHSRHLVHRDVKPGNVIVGPDGRVKVTDFGIVKAADSAEDELTRSGMVVGTARYLAPEQVDGRVVDERADVYSLGLVLYEMLVAKAPFEADTDIATAVARLTATPPPVTQERPDVPLGLASLIEHALARDPNERLPSAVAFRDAVAPFRREDHGRSDATQPVRRAARTEALTAVPVHTATTRLPGAAPAATAPAARPASRVGPVVLWVLAFALGALVGYLVYRAVEDDGSNPARAVVTAPAKPLAIASVADFDPQGDDKQEDHAHVGAVIDGNQATTWQTSRYFTRRFGNSKAGVGLVFDLGSAHSVQRVQVDARQADWSAQVYVRDTPAVDLAGWGAPLADAAALPVQAQLTVSPATRGRYVLLWFTNLPASMQLQVAEVRVLGTA